MLKWLDVVMGGVVAGDVVNIRPVDMRIEYKIIYVKM